MNFLDLRNASDEERRLISEIISNDPPANIEFPFDLKSTCKLDYDQINGSFPVPSAENEPSAVHVNTNQPVAPVSSSPHTAIHQSDDTAVNNANNIVDSSLLNQSQIATSFPHEAIKPNYNPMQPPLVRQSLSNTSCPPQVPMTIVIQNSNSSQNQHHWSIHNSQHSHAAHSQPQPRIPYQSRKHYNNNIHQNHNTTNNSNLHQQHYQNHFQSNNISKSTISQNSQTNSDMNSVMMDMASGQSYAMATASHVTTFGPQIAYGPHAIYPYFFSLPHFPVPTYMIPTNSFVPPQEGPPQQSTTNQPPSSGTQTQTQNNTRQRQPPQFNNDTTQNNHHRPQSPDGENSSAQSSTTSSDESSQRITDKSSLWTDLFKTKNADDMTSFVNEHDRSISPRDQLKDGTSKNTNGNQVATNNTSTSLASQAESRKLLDEFAPKLAKNIQEITLKHSLPFLRSRGFINRGNGCYINATLQALVACPPFYNLMHELGEIKGLKRPNSCTPIMDSFAEFFLNFLPPETSNRKNRTFSNQDQRLPMDELQAEPIEPRCIYNVLGHIKSECLKGAQEDAEEFLSSVLNGLHEEMVNLSAKPSKEGQSENQAISPIQEIFGGSLFSLRIAGKDRCVHRQPFFALQLDISRNNVKSVQDAIKSFTSPETIHDFYCSKTKQKLDASCRTSLDQLPPILILHLKQFVYTQDQGLRKLVKKIDYPIDFLLPDECLHDYQNFDRNHTRKSYKLLAVVYHDGNEAIKGHYLTDVYHIGSSQWIRCDDSTLKVISTQQLLSPDPPRTPYLLFYRRLNTLRFNKK